MQNATTRNLVQILGKKINKRKILFALVMRVRNLKMNKKDEPVRKPQKNISETEISHPTHDPVQKGE